jgi:hypothetical protein
MNITVIVIYFEYARRISVEIQGGRSDSPVGIEVIS